MTTQTMKIWWGIVSPPTGLIGTGWSSTEDHKVERWNQGVMHWPMAFLTRRAARAESQILRNQYQRFGWKFHPVKLQITVRLIR